MTNITQVYPRLSPRIVKVLSPNSEITMQSLVDELRDWEDEPWNMSYKKLITASGKQELGGGVVVGITAQLENVLLMFESRTTSLSQGTATSNDSGTTLTDISATFITNGIQLGATIINFTDKSVATVLSIDSETQITHELLSDGTLNTWTIGDEYKIWNEVQCEASGGNLVSIDNNGATMSPIMPSAFTQVIKTSSSSATLSELSAIQYSSFNSYVTIDISNGTSGTAYPIGTEEFPVNNLSEAKIIASNNGFNTFYIIGDITLNGGLTPDNVSDYILIGQGASVNSSKTTITFLNGCIGQNTKYKNAKIVGVQGGESFYENCVIGAISNSHCQYDSCALIGPNTITTSDPNGWIKDHVATLNNCYSIDEWYIVNYSESSMHQIYSNFSGRIKITNCTNSNAGITIRLNAGSIWLDSTVTAGNFIIRGVGSFINDSTNTTIDQSGFTEARSTLEQSQSLKYSIESDRYSHPGYGTFFYWNPINGDDTNDGLNESRPMKTFAAIQSLAVSGRSDVIFIITDNPSQIDITERITITKNNLYIRSPGRNIRFKPIGKNSGDTITVNADYFHLDKVKVETASTTTDPTNNDTCITINGINSNIEHCWITRGKHGVVYYGGDYHSLRNCELEYCWDSALHFEDASLPAGSPRDCIIEDCNIYYNETGLKLSATAPPSNSTRVNKIFNCHIYSNTTGADIGSNVIGTLINNNTSIFNNTTNIIDNGTNTYIGADETAAKIWDIPTTEHTTSGTFGNFIQKKILTLSKYLGLK